MDELLKLLKENPSMITALAESYISQYKPTVYSLGNMILNIFDDYANNQRSFEITAKVRMNQFEAYRSAGFTEDQAMTLLTNDIENLNKSINNFNKNVSSSKK